ncbi:MAG: hypothetical protein M9916_12070 [Crocinitomicaceae bacterium]|nr:hypothetical protein [Crocinitomicaceae bacterium]
MKNVFITLIIVIIPLISYNQTTNQNRIKELQNDISHATENNDTLLVQKLKKEYEFRMQIEQEIEIGNYRRAYDLSNRIKNLDKIYQGAQSIDDLYLRHHSLKRGFYIDVFSGTEMYLHGFASERFDGVGGNVGIAFGGRLGRKPPKNPKNVFKLDIRWISMSYLFGPKYVSAVDYYHHGPSAEKTFFSGVMIDLVSPGFYFGHAINEKSGIETSLNIGPRIGGLFFGDFDIGATLNAQFNYRINRYGIGLKLRGTRYLFGGYSFSILPFFSIKI